MNENDKLFSMDAQITEKSVTTDSRVKKKHFTALDFGLIVILLLAIVGIGFRTAIADWIMKSAPEETVNVIFKAEGVTAEQLAHMQKDRTLTLNGEAFGKLQSFTSQNGKTVVEQDNGDGTVEFVTVEDKNSYTVSGVMEVSGRYTDRGFVCQENTNLYVGKILNINSNSYTITVLITEIPRK